MDNIERRRRRALAALDAALEATRDYHESLQAQRAAGMEVEEEVVAAYMAVNGVKAAHYYVQNKVVPG